MGRVNSLHSKNRIYGIGLLALLSSIFAMRSFFKCSSIDIYMDSYNALDALIRADSDAEIIAAISATF